MNRLKILVIAPSAVVIDQHPGHLISEIVPGGAVDWPILRQLFLAGQDFFDDQINRAPILWQWNAQSLGAARLQLLEIFQRPIQAIGVIDAQASDSATARPARKVVCAQRRKLPAIPPG